VRLWAAPPVTLADPEDEVTAVSAKAALGCAAAAAYRDVCGVVEEEEDVEEEDAELDGALCPRSHPLTVGTSSSTSGCWLELLVELLSASC